MSAYGAIQRAVQDNAPLPFKVWPVRPSAQTGAYITTHHLVLSTARGQPGLIDYLHSVFAQVVDHGMTYPQEGEISRAAFEAYFLAADLIVGIIGPKESTAPYTELSIDGASGERSWEGCIAGFYYIKPNYPGRSSHICNAGFVVPPRHRGLGYGSVLAESYLFYAPRLGYQASVFNLVYVSNSASIRLWERLGFTKAGLIPEAGRLKKSDGSGEEYVDACIFYKRFGG